MSNPEKGKQEQVTMPPIDPQLLSAMYGPPQEDEIDLLEYWRVIWKSRALILIISLGVGVLAAAYSLTLPNIYRAEVLLAPISDDAGRSPALGGLAALTGISPSGGRDVAENLAVLESREFLWSFIKNQKLMPVLFEDAWDGDKGAWKNTNQAKQPILWSALRAFKGLLRVTTDKKTKLVTVSIEWPDAELAAEWANALVARLNEYLRQRAIAESGANLEYLNRELARTHVEDMRQSLFQLISQEQKKAMLANSRKQYAFRVLDAAVPPDIKAKPKRSRLVTFWAFIAGFVAVAFVLARESVVRRRKEVSEDRQHTEAVSVEATREQA